MTQHQRWTLAALLLVSGSWAQAPASKPAPDRSTPPRAIVYKAAAGSAPAARVTGGSRGSGDAAVRLDVLAPDETGLTTQEQPSLFWYQSKPATAKFELTLLQEGKAKPVLQLKTDRAGQAGIQRLKLSEHGVKLEPGVEYRWVVALVLDPKNRSKDLVASGFIKRVEASKELQDKLAKASPAERPAIYADAGIWHDALASLSDLTESQPDNPAWHEQRAELLRQVGLTFAAASETARPKS
jgi:hypothetical protein